MSRDERRGGTSRSRSHSARNRAQGTVSRSSQPSGGHHDRGNQIQENIKNQQEQKARQKQNQINENNRRRIEEMRTAQATQGPVGGPIPEQSIADRIKEEKTGDVYDTGWADKDRTESAEDYYGDVKSKIKLAEQLRAAGVTADQLTDEEKDYLSDVQFMQDEGVYGGVSGYEAEINKLKKNIVEGGAGYEDALRALAYLSGTKGDPTWTPSGEMSPGAVTPNEELAKISALGIKEYLRRKTKGDYQLQEDILTGKTPIEGLSPDFFKTFTGQTAGVGTTYYDKNTGKVVKEGDPNAQLGLWGNALGFDPSGQFSWSQIQDDPELYNKYLNRGTLWDDPLSGLFPKYSGGAGGGGGGGWGGGYGGYGGGGGSGGGGYGYSGGQDPMAQGYQRGQVGPGSLQEQVNQIYLGMSNLNAAPGFQKSRGGIVSLLGLN